MTFSLTNKPGFENTIDYILYTYACTMDFAHTLRPVKHKTY